MVRSIFILFRDRFSKVVCSLEKARKGLDTWRLLKGPCYHCGYPYSGQKPKTNSQKKLKAPTKEEKFLGYIAN